MSYTININEYFKYDSTTILVDGLITNILDNIESESESESVSYKTLEKYGFIVDDCFELESIEQTYKDIYPDLLDQMMELFINSIYSTPNFDSIIYKTLEKYGFLTKKIDNTDYLKDFNILYFEICFDSIKDLEIRKYIELLFINRSIDLLDSEYINDFNNTISVSIINYLTSKKLIDMN